MDQKPWLWRKKSTEKMIVANDKINSSPQGNQEEIQTLLIDKAELEKDLKILNDKLSSALSNCDAKDDIAKKQTKKVDEAMAGWEKAEAKAVTLKQELDEALQQRTAGEKRLTQLDAALKECMQQLRFVREEQEKRIDDAVTKASVEFEKSQLVLEEKQVETSKRLAKIGAENTHLSQALMAKENLVENLSKQKTQMELDLNALMTRLESTEKENASLKYEVRVLEKELDIRNEEREFSHRTAEVSHKQHLESAKKIAKLESECQRLRLLVRKRLPGPAALAKMKSEVDILGRDSVETRRRRNSSPTGLNIDLAVDNSPDTVSKKVNILTDHMNATEEENRALKEALNKKANELQLSRTMYVHTASKLSQIELHLDELSKVQPTLEPSSGFAQLDLPRTSISDVGSDDKVSCAESWASALISELEHFKHGKQRGSPSGKTVGVSDIDLMDDFVEMEKLAIVSGDKQSRSLHIPSVNAQEALSSLGTGLSGYSSEVTSIIPMSGVLEQSCTTQRKKSDELLEDVRVALAELRNKTSVSGDTRESSKLLDVSESPRAGGDISLKPTDKSLPMDSSSIGNNADILLTDGTDQQVQSDLGKSLHKIIEHVEGIISSSYAASETLSRKDANLLPYKNTETSSGYMVRVFQWKTSELSVVLQQFVHSCYDLLNGKSDVNRFTEELSSVLDWILNHCFSLQDVSSMKDAIKKHLDWDETRSEGEAEVGIISQFSEVDKMGFSQEQLSCSEKAEFQYNIRDENKRLKDELIDIESTNKELEGKLQLATDNSQSLMNKLQESEKTNASLQKEVENLKKSKADIENQGGKNKLMKDLDTQLTAAKAELNVIRHKFSSLEVELENKNGCCEELETACLELQLQLESITKKAFPTPELHQEEKNLRSDWEITAASEKLAECQETILNLGKQLKALAAPSEAVLFDKVISTSTATNAASVTATSSTTNAPSKKLTNQRSSLLDQMLAEDNAKTKDNKPPMFLEREDNSCSLVSNEATEAPEKILILNGNKHQNGDVEVSSLAIVPSKKKGSGSLWRKLLWRKRKSNSKKPPLPFTP